MKVFKYILAIVLAAGLIACQQENTQPGLLSDENEVEVTFDVFFPELIPLNTKSPMGEGPTELSLNLCLYGAGDGYVQNWVPTTIISTITEGGYIKGGTYKAKLPITDEQRIVHLFANAPDDIIIDYMDVVMEHMISEDNDGAFWQQVTLPHIKKQGNGEADPSSVRPLTEGVYLVRNFAKFIVQSALPEDEDYAHFVVKRWTLINTPDCGYVAPYTGNADKRFPNGYLNVKNYLNADGSISGNLLYRQLSQTDSYVGYMPSVAQINAAFPGDPADDPATDEIYVGNGAARYMYERPLPTTEQIQTSILVEIEFDGDHEFSEDGNPVSYWYKIEVLDDEGAYLPFLRDFVYSLKIEGLDVAGYDTASEAFEGAYFGNISASLETAGLNELSNGTSKIHVDQMDYTFLTGDVTEILTKPGDSVDAEPAQFWFQTGDNPAISVTTPGVGIITVEKFPVSGYEPAIIDFEANETGVISVDLATAGDIVKKSIIRVSGKPDTSNGKTIYREITINLMNKQQFAHGSQETSITGVPSSLSAPNMPVEITLHLPEDLGSSVFPIQVRIEAQNNTLSSVSPDLPVSTGPSQFDANRNTFFYIYTIKYSDYCKLNPRTRKYEYTYDFPITFYTTKNSDNSTKIDIRDLRGDFNPKELTLGTVAP